MQDIGQVKHIDDANHQILCDLPIIFKHWSNCFSDICNLELPHQPIHSTEPVPEPIPSITIKEVEVTAKKMKNGKQLE